MTLVWNTLNGFIGKKFVDIGRYAVLVLNRPIDIPEKYMIDIWSAATVCATADGGTDRWFEFVAKLPKDSLNSLEKVYPDLVSGDFDSIKPETLQECKEHCVKIINTPDQNKTDFTKAVEEILEYSNGGVDSIITIAENSGRLDHIMSNLNTLYTTADFQPHIDLYLLSSVDLSWLLCPGTHHIHVPLPLIKCRATCGLIPLGHPCTVSTTGLKWNLDKDKMQFGGLISSCNTYSEDCDGLVIIHTDSPLLWTTTLCLNRL